MEKSERYEISWDSESSTFEHGYLVLKPVIRIGYIHTRGFAFLFRDVLMDKLSECIFNLCKRYFFKSSVIPDAADQKEAE